MKPVLLDVVLWLVSGVSHEPEHRRLGSGDRVPDLVGFAAADDLVGKSTSQRKKPSAWWLRRCSFAPS